MPEYLAEQSDAKLRSAFYRSLTFVVSAAGIVLATSEDQFFPSGLTPVVALLSWLLIERLQWLRLPVLVGNLCGLAAFSLAASEFVGGTLERKLLAGSHLIVYLTWIVLVLPRGNRQHWWLIALSVLQIAISGILGGGIAFGGALLGMMLLLLWTLSVFSLFRAQDQHAEKLRNAQNVVWSPAAVGSESDSVENSADRTRHSWVSRSWRILRTLQAFLGLSTASSPTQSLAARRSSAQGAAILVRNGLQRDLSETWVGWRFRGMVFSSYLISVVLAIIVFAAFPRVWVQGGSLFGDMVEEASRFRSRTGFSSSVQLGDIGEIMQSNQRVLTFEIKNLISNEPVLAETFANAMQMDEIRFRGNVLAHYYQGQWTRGFLEKGFARGEHAHSLGRFLQLPSDYRLQITQDPPHGMFAFAPFPVSKLETENGQQIIQTELSGSLTWTGSKIADTAPRTFSVEVPHMDRSPTPTFEYWTIPEIELQDEDENRVEWLQEFAEDLFLMDGMMRLRYRLVDNKWVPWPREYSSEQDMKSSLPRLHELANQICTENGQLVEPQQRAERIVRYLSNENGFDYSLKQSRMDRSLDPVEDFLFNTKSGHCEYYASACTLMLQAVRVPARMVNGYYGCEINAVTGKYEVQQRHAHVWTEAYINNRWQTVEATPAARRREGLSAVPSSGLMTNFQTALTDLWNDGIHRMSPERQQMFFAPVLSTSKSLVNTIRENGLLSTVKQSAGFFLQSPSSWISWKVGVVTFVLLLGLTFLARLTPFRRLLDLLPWIRLNRWKKARSASSVIRFYEGFCSLCERHGLKFPPANSALENAQLAIERFQPHLGSPELRSVPARIAIAFNEVRFGSFSLTDDQAAGIGHDLESLSDALKTHPS